MLMGESNALKVWRGGREEGRRGLSWGWFWRYNLVLMGESYAGSKL